MAPADEARVNVYKVYFWQGPGAVQHVSLGLVAVGSADQGTGRFFHVTGHAAYGMDYEMRDSYDFGRSRTFAKQEYQFQIKFSSEADFISICNATPPPYDPAAQEQGVKASVDCNNWVADVLARTKRLAV